MLSNYGVANINNSNVTLTELSLKNTDTYVNSYIVIGVVGKYNNNNIQISANLEASISMAVCPSSLPATDAYVTANCIGIVNVNPSNTVTVRLIGYASATTGGTLIDGTFWAFRIK